MEKFGVLGLREMFGYNTDRSNGITGWGNTYFKDSLKSVELEDAIILDESGRVGTDLISKKLGLNSKVAGRGMSAITGKLLSGFQVFGTFNDVAYGVQNGNGFLGKVWGGAKWGVTSWLSSSIVSSAVAEGSIGIGGSVGASLIGNVGGVIAGPLGQIGGTAGSTWLMGLTGSAASLAGAAGAFGLAGGTLATAAAVGSYYAAKGSYSVLKSGYQYRQRMTTNINTAGSTAAFMNRNAFTMRSRAIESASSNNTQIKSAFGYEAQRSHFNSYRKLKNSIY